MNLSLGQSHLPRVLFLVKEFMTSPAPSRLYTKSEYKYKPAPDSPTEIFPEITNTNDEIEELHLKQRREKYLSEYDQKLITNLIERREGLFGRHEKTICEGAIEKLLANPAGYKSYPITPEKIHIIQYHVGKTVTGKQCAKCQRPMILQFRRDMRIITLDGFFWACTG